jgi:uncharacterized membrane protein YfcA
LVEFPVSHVETWWWLPPLVAFGVSCFTATGGLSGAFLMLPFQVSVLGFTGPGASPTNLFFNVVAIPSGVYRYHRENRMLWPLAWAIVLGTLPGMAAGAVIRVFLLPDPSTFKPFAGFVLLFIGVRLFRDVLRRPKKAAPAGGAGFQVSAARFSASAVTYSFHGDDYSVSTPKIFVLSLIVGVAGGAYGIGGGAVIAPFLVSVFGLPVYTIAGAALFSTFVGSIFGVIVYWLLDLFQLSPGVAAAPDLLLGLSLGVGGAAGMYVGARLQRHLPARLIKTLLTIFLLFVAGRYIVTLF